MHACRLDAERTELTGGQNYSFVAVCCSIWFGVTIQFVLARPLFLLESVEI